MGPGRDLECIKILFIEYLKELGVDLAFQNIDEEFAKLPGKYHRNRDGFLYIAHDKEKAHNGQKKTASVDDGKSISISDDKHVAACICLRKIDDKIAEIKRLFVRPAYRKYGVATQMMKHLMQEARAMGYEKLRLDTLVRLKAANGLYKKLGFYSIPPYIFNPIPDALYFEIDITPLSGEK